MGAATSRTKSSVIQMLGVLSEDDFTCILFPSVAEHIKMKVKLTDLMIKIIKASIILECSAC